MMLLPRVLALQYEFSLSFLRNMGDSERILNLSFESVKGLARKAPLVGASLILAHLSVTGLPLLAGFPTRLAIWSNLASEQTPAAILSLVGSSGLLLGGLRTLGVLIRSPESTGWQVTEKPAEWIFLGIGIVLLFLVGLLPGWFLAPLANVASVFELLAP
jgi:formate hydrogenlyase subunit 3/multisubunit Na+/H+ antiporter MnhD subunit